VLHDPAPVVREVLEAYGLQSLLRRPEAA
jgi:hypothetical protein